MKHIAFLNLVMVLMTFLAACSPQRLQSSRLAEYKDGKPVYNLTGYTDLNDYQPNASRKYIEDALSEACPAGVKILFLQEYDAHNGLGKFLYWETLAGCK